MGTCMSKADIAPPRRADSKSSGCSLWTSSVGSSCFFPAYALGSDCVCSLGQFQMHERLKADEQLSVWHEEGGVLVFASHQWTGCKDPDPSGLQYETLVGFLANKCTFAQLLAQMGGQRGEQTDDGAMKHCRTEVLRQKPMVWVDYWSIPQLDRDDQVLAIQSIPAYASSAAMMIVLAPRIVHRDSGVVCDLNSYRGRGWCRLEELVFGLKDASSKKKARVRILDKPGGEPFEDAMMGAVRARNPLAAVLRGRFTCCDWGHVRCDGSTMTCDKILLKPIVQSVHEHVAKHMEEEGDMPTWRRLLSTEWSYCSDEPSRCSAQEFLDKLNIVDATKPAEGTMYALHYAAYANNPVAVAGLVELGADLECRDADGNSPLSLAAMSDSVYSSEALLDAGADIEALGPGTNGVTPLLSAAFAGSYDAARLLLERGANIEARFFPTERFAIIRSCTALHTAATFGHQAIVDLLLEFNADVEAMVGRGGPFEGKFVNEIVEARGFDLSIQPKPWRRKAEVSFLTQLAEDEMPGIHDTDQPPKLDPEPEGPAELVVDDAVPSWVHVLSPRTLVDQAVLAI